MGLPSVGLPSNLRPGHGGGRAQSQLEYRQRIRLPRSGVCPQVPVHLIALVDSSASVVGGVDPVGMRFVELGEVLRRAGRRCRCRRELVSVIHFDHPVGNDALAVGLKDDDQIESALHAPVDGAGCSNMGRSLAAARRLAAHHPEHHSVIVALTDFQLFDSPSVVPDLVAFPGDVHACVLGGGFTGLDGATRVTVTKISRNDRPGAVASAVFAALAAGRQGSGGHAGSN